MVVYRSILDVTGSQNNDLGVEYNVNNKRVKVKEIKWN
jgi:hypothetical protein